MTGRLPWRLRGFGTDRGGTAIIEFALGAPLFIVLGGYGIELSNYAYTQVQVSQAALTLADNASRIGVNNGQAVYQLREGDLNDILQGARLAGGILKLTTNGRVTISSLEKIQRSYSDNPAVPADTAPVQRIHWQRCIGMRGGTSDPGFDSSYGTALPLTTAGTDATFANRGSASSGMGKAPAISAPNGAGVIFVEVNYEYQPLFGTAFMKKVRIRSTSTFIVRDRRDFTQIYNPMTALGTSPTRATCDLHNA